MEGKKQKPIKAKIDFLKNSARLLTKEVSINYLADLVGIVFQWVFQNWKIVFIPILVFLWSGLVTFASMTYAVTGLQIIVGTVIALLFLLLVLNASKIRKLYISSRKQYFTYNGFYWKGNEEGYALGPYCTKCAKQMSQLEDNSNEAMSKTIDEMFGEKTIYVYKCDWCNAKTFLDVPLAKLKKNAQKELQEKITSR